MGNCPQPTVCGSEPRTCSCHHRLADEPELGHLAELACVVGKLEEGHQPGALARAEAIPQLFEVAREEPGRIAVALARLMRQLLRLRAGQPHGRDERVLEL